MVVLIFSFVGGGLNWWVCEVGRRALKVVC